MWSDIFCFQNTRDTKYFFSNFNSLTENFKTLILNILIDIFGNGESLKIADHILVAYNVCRIKAKDNFVIFNQFRIGL